MSVPELSSDSGGLLQLVFGLAKLEASPLHILVICVVCVSACFLFVLCTDPLVHYADTHQPLPTFH